MSNEYYEELVAKYDYNATESHELSLKQGEQLKRLDRPSLWWKVMNSRGNIGYVPSNHVKPVRQNIFANLKGNLGRRKPREGRSVTRDCFSKDNHPTNNVINGYSSEAELTRTNSVHDVREPMDSVKRRPEDVFYSHNKKSVSSPARNHFGQINQQSTILRNTKETQPSYCLPPTFPEEAVSRMEAQQLPICRVIAPYTAQLSDELSIFPGQNIRVIRKSADGWWFGQLLPEETNMPVGWFPSNLVVMISFAQNNKYHIYNKNDANGSQLNVGRKHTVLTENPFIAPKAHAISLYPFERAKPGDLSFDRNELIKVLEDPSEDNSWWLCRNSRGNVGWVPSSHLKLLTVPHSFKSQNNFETQDEQLSYETYPQTKIVDVNDSKQNDKIRLKYAKPSIHYRIYGEQPWFWGAIERAECDRMLRVYSKPGEFLVRDNKSNPGNLSITVNSGIRNRNFKILIKHDGYHIGWRTFRTMEELLDHYQRHYIFISQYERCCLTRPFVFPPDIYRRELPGVAARNEEYERTYEVVTRSNRQHSRTNSL